MTIADMMTRDPVTVAPDDTLRRAAELMDELNVGVLPVVVDGRLIGMLTDRDITVRATAAGLAPDDADVSEAMSGHPRFVYEDQEIGEAERIMGEAQVRRLPVLDREERLVGVLALGDLATEGAGTDTLEAISTPSEPDR